MATRDMKMKFALEGEQKYRQAMKDAANAMKVLNSESKLATAQFKQTGDAQKYASQQAEILEKKIAEQEKAVKAAQDALKELAEKGYDANSTQIQRWQIKLNSAQTELSKMQTELASVTAQSGEATTATDELSGSLDHLDKTSSIEAVANGVGKITTGLEAAISKAKDLAKEIASQMKEAAAWADELATTATMYEMSPEELQRMRYTADLIDTNVETIIGSQQKLSKNMLSDSKDVMAAFAQLGVVTTRYGLGRDLADVFWETGEALMKMDEGADKNALAMTIFGKSWRELIPLFTAGRQKYEETMAAQQVVSQENVDKLGALDDAIQNLENRYEVLKQTILASLAPAFTTLADSITKLMEQFNAYLETDEGKEAMQALGDAVTALFEDLTNIKFSEALSTAQELMGKFVESLEWIKENHGTVTNAIGGIVAAWGALKVTAGISTLLQLVNGLKGLGNGAGAAAAASGAEAAVTGAAAAKGFTLPKWMPSINAAAVGQAASVGVMGTSWLSDFTVLGRDLRNGMSLSDAIADSVETVKKTFSAENLAQFRQDWEENVLFNWAKGLFADKGPQLSPHEVLEGQRATANAVDASGADPALQAAWGLFVADVNSNASTATAALLQDLAERYEKAFMGDWEDEPVIEAIIDNLSTETGDALSEVLEDIASGAGVDPLAAAALVDKVREELAEKLGAGVDKTLTESGDIAGANMSTAVANGITANMDAAIAAADALAAAVSDTLNRGINVVQAPAGRQTTTGGSSGNIDVHLMVGENQLAEVVVPMVNGAIGEQISLIP